jgi:hypothetical protein
MWFNLDPRDLLEPVRIQHRCALSGTGQLPCMRAAHRKPASSQAGRRLLTMVDPADALKNSDTRRTERGQLERDWILASAECGRQARDALAKAAEALNEQVPGRPADSELARAWAEVGQGWAALSHAEAARSIAAAAFAVDQGGVNTFPTM